MKTKALTLRITRTAILVAVLLLTPIQAAHAIDIQFYQSNDILYYDPGAADACIVRPNTPAPPPTPAPAEPSDANTERPDDSAEPSDTDADTPEPSAAPTGTNTGNGATNNRDYKDRPVISDDHMKIIQKNQPIYEKAAAETKIPWQIFAVLHLRESVLADSNPPNGQGLYQDFARAGNSGKDYPPGAITDEEFLRQTIYAGKIVEEKAGSKFDLVKQGDIDAIKDMFFGYNGRAAGYVTQAVNLGFSEEEASIGEGSPYVMNIADAKRDPEVAKKDGTWGQVKVDLGPIEYPANGDHGAFIMYGAIAGVASTTGSCTNGRTVAGSAGPNGWELADMKLFYQIKEPWASKKIGGLDIMSYGCGPTSTAMAIATLTGDTSVNPENMAQLFYDQQQEGVRGFSSGGTSFFVFDAVSEKYGVTIDHLGTDRAKVVEAIKRGSLVIVSGQSTLGGHVYLIRGFTDDGKFLVADPASEANTNNENGLTLDQIPADIMKDDAAMSDFAENVGGLAVKNGFWEVRKP